MEYKNQVQKLYKKLSVEDQKILYHRMCNGDKQARDTLVESCLPMVIKLADKFAKNNKHIDFEDLVQEGNMALVKAVEVFNPNKYGAFSTLAWWAVTNALISMTHKSSYKMKHPFSVSSYASKMMKDIESSGISDPEKIAKKLNRKVETIKKMKDKMYNRTGMFSSSVTEKEKIEQDTPDHFCLGYLIDILDNNELVSERDANIFKDYYGLSGNKRMTSNEIAKIYLCESSEITDIIKRVRRDLTQYIKKVKES
tara:strand:- start:502 stop:1263 length:762 start_codon:yes stop_codon:yes gene_type:complete